MLGNESYKLAICQKTNSEINEFTIYILLGLLFLQCLLNTSFRMDSH